MGGSVPPVEAWKKVLVDSTFLGSTHGQQTCVDCHDGDASASDMDGAHIGLVADPSDSCATCHVSEASRFIDSQHRQLTGYRELIAARAGLSQMSSNLEGMFEANCNTCHVTCGQCHISRPNSVGKGFVRGHQVLRRPSMTENCTACHGSRIGEEFRGEHAGIPADVHYNNGMQCVACHTADEMHGHGDQGSTRYDVSDAATCQDCHDVTDSNTHHQIHGDRLSCQVCHSVEYKNCANCHVGKGLKQPSWLDFKIGRNPLKSERRPADFVVLRHIPIAPDSYRDYGVASLPAYTDLPTWKFATPHNIRRETPQTADCTTSCHNNTDLFLTADDLIGLSPEEVEANQSVIVTQIP